MGLKGRFYGGRGTGGKHSPESHGATTGGLTHDGLIAEDRRNHTVGSAHFGDRWNGVVDRVDCGSGGGRSCAVAGLKGLG